MHAQAEPRLPAGLEHRARLVGVEGAAARRRRRSSARAARHASSISPQTSSTYSSARPSYSAGTACAPRKVTSSVSSPATSARAPLGLDVEAVARLDLEVRDPGAQCLGAASARQLAQLVLRRRPGRLGGHPDPRRRVRAAGHPGGELVGAVAGEDEVGVAVDEPRDHAAAARVEPLVRGRAGALDRRDALALDHQRRVAHEPERALAEGGVAGDEQPDVVDHERAHAAHRPRSTRSSSRGDVDDTCAAVAHDRAAVDDHVGARPPALAANTTAARASSGRVPARRTPSPATTATRSARAPGAMRPGVVPAQAGVPGLGRRAQQRGGGVDAALPAREPLVELDRARLLEEVDDRVRVAAERQRRAGLGERAHAADAVGEVALGGRADAAARRGAAEQPDVRVGQVRRVDRREARSSARRRRRAAPWGSLP